jgi:hypothetical protein
LAALEEALAEVGESGGDRAGENDDADEYESVDAVGDGDNGDADDECAEKLTCGDDERMRGELRLRSASSFSLSCTLFWWMPSGSESLPVEMNRSDDRPIGADPGCSCGSVPATE